MDWLKILQIALPIILTSLVVWFLSKDKNKAIPRNREGKFVLRLNRSHQILSLFCIALALFFLGVGVLIEEEHLFLICSPMIIMFGFLGWLSYAYYLNHEIIFNENLIRITNWKEQTEVISWEQIEKISYSNQWGYIYLHIGKEKLKISKFVSGLSTFIAMMEHRTEWTAKKIGLQ